MTGGVEFINATDGRRYYVESFLKCIVYGYNELLTSKFTYSRAEIHSTIKKVTKSPKAKNEIEDFLSTDLVNKYIKPYLHKFGLQDIVVNVGVRETKENVTVGHLDIKFEVPNLGKNHYYAFEAKRLDKNLKKQRYYLSDGIYRFTSRQYYPETDTLVAGMIGFIEIDLSKSKAGRVALEKIKDALNTLLDESTTITSTQPLKDFKLLGSGHSYIEDFKYLYHSKHKRDDDNAELHIYHVLLDYYDLLQN